jgi:hypothetical protein
MRALFAAALIGLGGLCGDALAATMTVFGDRADTQVHRVGIFNGDPGQNGGQSGVNGGFNYSMVFVFQLPTLAPGQTITGADFGFFIDSMSSAFFTDLYGLSYRLQSTVLASDWYSGTGDPNNSLLQAGIVAPSFISNERINTNASGDTALLNYILAQYAAGAVGGDFIFLRLSHSTNSSLNTNTNFYSSADRAFFLAAQVGDLPRWQQQYSPRLDLTLEEAAVPEPSLGMGVLVGLSAMVFFGRKVKM